MATSLKVLGPVSPAVPSVTDEAIAAYLRIDLGEGAAEIGALRPMAEKIASEMTGRAVLNTSFRLSAPSWPCRRPSVWCFGKAASREIELPRSPLISVTSVKYYDAEGEQQTFSANDYLVITGYEPGMIYLKEGNEWPELYDRPDAVQIEFVAGYGTTTAEADPVMRQAILLLTRHFYSGGTPNISDTADGMAAERLLLSQRVSGFAT